MVLARLIKSLNKPTFFNIPNFPAFCKRKQMFLAHINPLFARINLFYNQDILGTVP